MASGALAETITHGSHSVEIDFLSIGPPGNSGDSFSSGLGSAFRSGVGQVDYGYRIGKFEVTAGQWATVRAADARVGGAGSWNGSQPVGDVSLYSAAKFANWLTSGSALAGVYQFSPTGDDLLSIDRESALASYDKVYVLPTLDEWYKAAWFNPRSTNRIAYEAYSLNDANNIDHSMLTVGTGGANVDDHMSAPWAVGTGGAELNGTFDMTGNVWEWTEAFVQRGEGQTVWLRVGGAWNSTSFNLASGASHLTSLTHQDPIFEGGSTGFRMVVIPEPSSGLMMVLAGGAGWFIRVIRRVLRPDDGADEEEQDGLSALSALSAEVDVNHPSFSE